MLIPFLLLYPIHDQRHCLINRHVPRVDRHFRIHRHLVWIIDPREVRNIAAARPCIESLDVAPFTFLERCRDVDLDEIIT